MTDKVQIDQSQGSDIRVVSADPLPLVLTELRRISRLLEIIADEHVEVEDVEVDIDL